MLRVALTGGIATGKSYVLERFRLLGIACLDADEIVHGTMVPGAEGTKAVANRFGEAVLAADGAVDRAKLASIVFADPLARRDLEAIVHPAVYRAIAAGLRGFELTGSTMAVVDVPLLYETGHASDFDRVIATSCPVELQIRRLVARGMSAEAAEKRMAAQMATEAKASRADFIIDTSGGFEETDRQVDNVLEELNRVIADR
jgi:dephospho-CoA kinase